MSHNQTSHRAVIVPASAGSGKTFRIAQEYIFDVLRDRYRDDGTPYFDDKFYKRILAVTFTNKATEEMKTRILKEIHILASGEESDHLKTLMGKTSLSEEELRRRAMVVRSNILHDYSHFTVLTNDTFFQRILRAFVRELNIDMNFTTELDTAPVLSKSIDTLIDNVADKVSLRDWLSNIAEDRIMNGGNWNFRKAIYSLTGELFNESARDIIANCKSKEELSKISASLKEKVDEEEKKLKKAYKELQIEAEQVISEHNLDGAVNSQKLKAFRSDSDPLFNWTDSVIGYITLELEKWFNKNKANEHRMEGIVKLQEILRRARNLYMSAQTWTNTRNAVLRNYQAFALLKDLQDLITEENKRENSMLLSETKHILAKFIQDTDTPFIYEKVGNYFDKFMIDEFQDTSFKEWNNFLPLLRDAMDKSVDNSVLIVGDVKQSIYRWRGGDWRILGNEVAKQLRDCFTDPLECNWRSLPEIVEFNKWLFNKVVETENTELNKKIDEAKATGRISEECHAELFDTLKNAYYKHGQKVSRKCQNRGYVSVHISDDVGIRDTKKKYPPRLVDDEGTPLYLNHIRQVLEKGYKPCDITILVRKNDVGQRVATELLSYSATLPEELRFEVTSEEALSLISSPAVKMIIALMRLAVNRKDNESLILYKHYHQGLSSGATLSDEENEFLDTIRSMSPDDAFEAIAIRYAEDIKGQTAYTLALHEHIIRFCTGKVADLPLFDKWWRDKNEKDGKGKPSVRVERSERSIEILTIHKAKGLENKVIIIPDCSWIKKPRPDGIIKNVAWAKPVQNAHTEKIGMFPVSINDDVGASHFAEAYFREVVYTCVDAINMLYVATTRAKEQLHIFVERSGDTVVCTDTILASVFGAITNDSESEKGPKFRCQRLEDAKYCHYECGTFDAPEPEKEKKKDEKREEHREILNRHDISPVSLKLRTTSARYFSDEPTELTPRSNGIRMHRLFEEANTSADILNSLDLMVENGEMSNDEAAELRAQIEDTLTTSVAGEWFDGSWERIYRERTIVQKSDKEGVNVETKRPDRVMVRGKEAVVVDYKFGREKESHKEQIRNYMGILGEMGYSSVKGYVWYVSAGKIVQI